MTLSLAIRSTCRRWLLAGYVLACLGCATAHEIPQAPPGERADSMGTGPGWHTLSPYFGVDIKPSSRATFYYFNDPENPKTRKAIGEQYVFWTSDFAGQWTGNRAPPKSGPRENAYGVSDDGRSLLYFTERKQSFFMLFEASPNSFPAELHLFRHGLGDSLILSGVKHTRSGPRAPRDAVIYQLPDTQRVVTEAKMISIRDILSH